MPVYWFALSQCPDIDTSNAILIFIILHLLVYPSSNGYNSYMDKDTSSIGGLKEPLPPTRQLFYITIILDIIAIGLSLLITWQFALGILLYILASRAYSYRGIRLKKYPVAGYATVVVFQGAVTYFLVYHGAGQAHELSVPGFGLLASSMLIGGFYPLTQIYQHEEDVKDGVRTISYALGIKGTFIFTGIVYALAFGTLGILYYLGNEMRMFIVLQIFMLPVLVYFFIWFRKVWLDEGKADFMHTMRMNIIASLCTNLGFITLLILKILE